MDKEQKARAIASYEGWEEGYFHNDMVKGSTKTTIFKLTKKYSSFNGLVELLERINQDNDNKLAITIDIMNVTVHNFTVMETTSFFYEDTPLVDALQDAFIFYFKTKQELNQ